MSKNLDLATLQNAVSGSAAAFRCRRKLQPAGGAGDKVFPRLTRVPCMPSSSVACQVAPSP